MPITVAYCRNDLRKNDIYITSTSGGRLAPGCSNTVVMDVEVIVYVATGYLDFSWEQLYGPPVTLTYPDPSDLTLVTFPYTADGYERKFRFWVNATTGNEYKRAYYDIVVGDNFFETVGIAVDNNTATAIDKNVAFIYDRGYNVIYTDKANRSELIQNSTIVNTTGSSVAYYALPDYNYSLKVYLDSYFSTNTVINKFPTSELEWLGHRVNIAVDNLISVDGIAQYATTTYYNMVTQLLEESWNINVDNYTYADALTTWTTEYKNIIYQDLNESWNINIDNYTYADAYIVTVTVGSGVIDL